jgi:hypothetical protein
VVKARLQAYVDASAHEQQHTWRDVLCVFRDRTHRLSHFPPSVVADTCTAKIFLGAFMYFGLMVPAYAYAFFAPSIVNALGFGVIGTQLRSVLPWACAFALAMIIALASDHTRHRWLFSVFPALVCVAGFAILLVYPKSVDLRYGALFLAVAGASAARTLSAARSHSRRRVLVDAGPRLLVQLEPGRTPPARRRCRVSGRVRQHRRYHRCVRLPRRGRAALYQGPRDLPSLCLFEHAEQLRVCFRVLV